MQTENGEKTENGEVVVPSVTLQTSRDHTAGHGTSAGAGVTGACVIATASGHRAEKIVANYDLPAKLREAWLLVSPKLMVQLGSFGLFQGALSALMGVGGLPLTMSYLTLATD